MRKARKATRPEPLRQLPLALIAIAFIPLAMMLWVWLSALAFVPVPWPDDSAFYFVGKHLFSWPPRWVMISQAPFEPTYTQWNFNTMPLFPILIGLGRLIGIDGSFAIKIYSLLPWALSGVVATLWVWKKTRSLLLALSVAVLFSADPIHRWASVLVRPESLVALCGVILVFGLAFGFPRWAWAERVLSGGPRWFEHLAYRLADPVAVLLAVAAYAHFNAIHLLFPVVAAFWHRPRRLFGIAWKTAFFLSPWLLTVALRPVLFFHQMQTQWTRLAVQNDWLKTFETFLSNLTPAYGSPEPWPDRFRVGAVILAVVLISALMTGLILLVTQVVDYAQARLRLLAAEAGLVENPDEVVDSTQMRTSLLPAAAWVWGAVWLWHSKPEIWFVFYIHMACWTFLAVLFVHIARLPGSGVRIAATLPFLLLGSIFMNINIDQAHRMGSTRSWNWPAYHEFVKCIDDRLSSYEKQKGAPLKVWGPTFPDVLIELSRKHPRWEYTRTCDFMQRTDLALQHGYDADAVVVTETLQWPERTISEDWSKHTGVRSVWMDWNDYFLKRLNSDPFWKQTRYLCQRGRWMAFIFLK